MSRLFFVALLIGIGACKTPDATCRARIDDCLAKCDAAGVQPPRPGESIGRDELRSPCEQRCHQTCR